VPWGLVRIMKKRNFGRSGLAVSELCFGTMNFGWTIDRATAFALLDAYRSAGGAFLQSVHVSPALPFLPEAFRAPESWMGAWMRDRRIPRDELVLATRLASLDLKAATPESFAQSLRRCCEASLQRLGTHYLDLLIIEWTPDLLPAGAATTAFAMLKDAGLVRHVAFANAPLWRLMEQLTLPVSPNRRMVDGLQTRLSVLSPQAEYDEVLDLCQSNHLGLIVTSALGDAPMNLRIPAGDAAHDPALERREAIRRFLGAGVVQRETTVEQAALAWVLSHPQVSSVITGAASLRQLEESIRATHWGRYPWPQRLPRAGDGEWHTRARRSLRNRIGILGEVRNRSLQPGSRPAHGSQAQATTTLI